MSFVHMGNDSSDWLTADDTLATTDGVPVTIAIELLFIPQRVKWEIKGHEREKERRIILGVGPNVISLFCCCCEVIIHKTNIKVLRWLLNRLTGSDDAV